MTEEYNLQGSEKTDVAATYFTKAVWGCTPTLAGH